MMKYCLLSVYMTLLTAVFCCDIHASEDDLTLAMSLYERGSYERAEAMFAEISANTGDPEAEGYWVLCGVKLKRPGNAVVMDSYIRKYPHSGLVPQIKYAHALNLFDEGRYQEAVNIFDSMPKRSLYRSQRGEYLFKRAWCDFELGNYSRAATRFREIASKEYSDYTAPSYYTLGYICYIGKNFQDAEKWFAMAGKDRRFSELSDYYVLECRFMQKDYVYVTQHGPDLMKDAPEVRRGQLARLVSEAFLVTGDVKKAKEFYALEDKEKPKTDADYFHAGSILYAAKDWAGAVEKFSAMTDRTDSLGQLANYQMAHCYIQMRNKVAAMGCFKDASAGTYDANIAEDAHYNYAKLAFDLNSDVSGFENYLARYSDRKRGDEIYSYMALGALKGRDYAGAVEAYGKVVRMDGNMKRNYLKANYLRAAELIGGSSWAGAVPYLQTVIRGTDTKGQFGCLARYWLAETYFRMEKYAEASGLFNSLLKAGAFVETDEYGLISYNIAFCYFRQKDYRNAETWFTKYIDTPSPIFRREALIRRGDCRFMQRNYGGAAASYEEAMLLGGKGDIYPYYQAALSYGFMGDNKKKIETLSEVSDIYSNSDFYPEAVYELGRAYAREGASAKAGETFRRVVENVKDTSCIALALIELGALAQAEGANAVAMGYYRRVVEKMPSSGCADDALAAIESIYRAEGNPEGYLAYIDSIGKSSLKTEAEKEQMIFNAAEQVFLSGNRQKALAALQSYQERYPGGTYRIQAEFYIAESLRAAGELENAASHYAAVKNSAEGTIAEIATLHWSDISYRLQRYEDAFSGYCDLIRTAVIEDNASVAKIGAMRSAFACRKYGDAFSMAGEVIAENGENKTLLNESHSIEAKSLLALSRRTEAMKILADLASDPLNSYGAEAVFMLVQDSYDRGDFEETENRVYKFSDSGTTQRYWLAKSFIVLGDSFAERGEIVQAKATFKSIMDSYVGQDDDVRESVAIRLKKLNELQEAGYETR